jgi:hypothetical protein
LDNRIIKTISNTSFVTYAKTSETKVTPNKTKTEFTEEAVSGYDSIIGLIERREKIKAAIVASNASTLVEICGKDVTVAAAIDMKNSISYKKRLLNSMKSQYDSSVVNVSRRNETMESKIDDLVATAFGKESKTKVNEDDYRSIADPYRTANEVSLVDPLDIAKKIKSYEEYIEEFESTVDAKLQVSNCVTYIEIED